MIAKLIGAFILSEFILAFIFNALYITIYQGESLSLKGIFKVQLLEVFKGVIERVFLAYALINGFAHGMIAYGAIKLGTRLKHNEKDQDKEDLTKKENQFNSFFIIGNFLSMIIAITYYLIWKHYVCPIGL